MDDDRNTGAVGHWVSGGGAKLTYKSVMIANLLLMPATNLSPTFPPNQIAPLEMREVFGDADAGALGKARLLR